MSRQPRSSGRWATAAGQAVRYLTLGVAMSVIRNWTLALLSLVLSVSLWLYVTEAENPVKVDTFPGLIPVEVVNVPSNLAVAAISETQVSVRIEAPEDVWDRLSIDDFRARVDLSGVTTREVSAKVNVTTSHRDVDVIEPAPREIAVTLEPMTSRVVPVQVDLVGSPPVGFEVAATEPSRIEARLIGPETLVNQVQAVCAEVNLSTGVKVSFTQTVILKAKDKRCGDIQGVSIDPEDVRVSVEMQQIVFSAGFIVAPAIRGAPAAGFQIASVTVEPALVRVSGPVEVLQSIDAVSGIPTEEVSVDGATAGTLVRTVALTIPEGATVEGASEVTVRVNIVASTGQRVFEVAPQLRNVPQGLAATLATTVVRITLQGQVSLLDTLTPSDVLIYADLTGLKEGLHLVELRVQAPAGTALVSIDPPAAGVALAPP